MMQKFGVNFYMRNGLCSVCEYVGNMCSINLCNFMQRFRRCAYIFIELYQRYLLRIFVLEALEDVYEANKLTVE